jgi:hypothetical protein
MKLLLIISLLLHLPSNATGKTYKKNKIDQAHRTFSTKILAFSRSIDEFFSDDKHEQLTNKSKLKFTLSTHFREAAGPYVIPDINYQLILPRTQKRFRLIIENEEVDTKSDTSETKALAKTGRAQDTSSAAGIRYMISATGIKFYTDTGVIVDVPPKVFARFTAKKQIQYKNWLLKVKEQLKWVNTTGITSDLDLDFDKRLSRKVLLRMVNNFNWSDEDYIIVMENGPSIFQQINKTSAISYHAHIISINQPEYLLDNYLFQLTYRTRVYGKWLYMNLVPFVNFPRSRNFHRTPGFLLKFDAVAGYL